MSRVDDRTKWKSSEQLHSDFCGVTKSKMSLQAWAARMKVLGVPKSDNALRLGGQHARFWQASSRSELRLVAQAAVALVAVGGRAVGPVTATW